MIEGSLADAMARQQDDDGTRKLCGLLLAVDRWALRARVWGRHIGGCGPPLQVWTARGTALLCYTPSQELVRGWAHGSVEA